MECHAQRINPNDPSLSETQIFPNFIRTYDLQWENY